MDLSRDIVMGHEFCAEIVDHGPGTTKSLKTGTRVCSMPRAASARAASETVGYSNDNPGGYGEYMRLTEALLLEVPNGLSTEHAALTEPMAVGLHAVEKARLDKNDAPLVIGCGPVGLAVIAALRLKNVEPIVAADFSQAPARARDGARRRPRRRSAEGSVRELEQVAPGSTLRGAELPPGSPAQRFACRDLRVRRRARRDRQDHDVGARRSPHRRGRRVHGARLIEPMFGINKELNLQFVLGYTPEEFAITLHAIAEGQDSTSSRWSRARSASRAWPRPSKSSARPSGTPRSSSSPGGADSGARAPARRLSGTQARSTRHRT